MSWDSSQAFITLDILIKSFLVPVPKKVLKDRFDTPPEPDEPHQNDVDHDHDELYDDDQFYKEPEAIPPETRLQGDLAKGREADIIPSIITVQSSSVRPPLRNRDDSSLEGEWTVWPS